MLHYRDFLGRKAYCKHSACIKVPKPVSDVRTKVSSLENGHTIQIRTTDVVPWTEVSSECIPDHSNEFILKYCVVDQKKKKSVGEP